MSIALANRAYDRARTTAATTSLRRTDRARQLRLMESLIAEVEAHNLSGRRDVPTSLRFAVQGAAASIEPRPPRALWKVSTSSRLHEVLLEWQGALLDAVCPQRLEYHDRVDRH